MPHPYLAEIKSELHRHRYPIHFFIREALKQNLTTVLDLGAWLGMLARNLQSRHPFERYIAYEAVTEYAEVLTTLNPTLEVINRTICEPDKWVPYFVVDPNKTLYTSASSSTSNPRFHSSWIKKAVGTCITPDQLLDTYYADLPRMIFKSNIEGHDVSVLKRMVVRELYPACMLVEIWKDSYQEFFTECLPALCKHYDIPIMDHMWVNAKTGRREEQFIFVGFAPRRMCWWHILPEGDNLYREIDLNPKVNVSNSYEPY